MPKILRHCEWCNDAFEATSWEVNRGRGRYCSVSCKGAYGRSFQDVSGENHPQWKGGVWKANTIKKAKAWNEANREKQRIHASVNHEIKMGRLVRGPCCQCGSEVNIDAHHHDYAKPLEVTWLCRSCHLKEHRSAT